MRTHSEHMFINFVNENRLAQLTQETACPKSENILDLVITSNAELIDNVRVQPGISDQNLVLFDINVTSKTQRKLPTTIYKYDKADKVKTKGKFLAAAHNYFQQFPDENTVEDNWRFFTTLVSKAMSMILSLKNSGKPSHPYITCRIIREPESMGKVQLLMKNNK